MILARLALGAVILAVVAFGMLEAARELAKAWRRRRR
jgi:hypothetical protein